ncbi:transposase (plasmid) [Streptomyces sp. KN37]|nr:transposase [Streptomyces sp. KN37]WPO76758.1 transposase [Streptomyces sp. KN37]
MTPGGRGPRGACAAGGWRRQGARQCRSRRLSRRTKDCTRRLATLVFTDPTGDPPRRPRRPACRLLLEEEKHLLKRFADAAKPEDLFTGQWQNRPSVLDDYKPYLDDRWDEGITNAWKLWEEIVPLGYKGSYQRVRAYLHMKRTSPRPVTARPPSPRTVSRWILSRPETLTEPEQLQLKTIRTQCPELDALTRHVRSFATMLTDCQGERLTDWLAAVRQDDLPSLHTLAAGIDRDLDAVTAGLTLPWSSGAVEGHVNRIKMLKRQMFGRAGFQLLRKRVLLA